MTPLPDLIGDRAFASPPIYLSDLDRCTPSDALSRESRRGCWRTLEYETPAFAGTMLMANPETGAPDVTCRPRRRGPHAISIGIHPTDVGQIDWRNATGDVAWLRARLTGDPAFSILEWEPGGHLKRRRLEEIFWKVADLTDQEIIFSQYRLRAGAHPEPGDRSPARIAYVKLVPLTGAEAALVRADRADRSHKRLQGHTDLSNVLQAGTVEAIREELEPFYNRRPPYLDYEEPLTAGFRAATGRDARQLPPDDPEWLRYRAGVLTGFMRRVRGAMAAEAGARGSPIEISACILGSIADNLFFGIDVAAWANGGLVDTVMPYSGAPYALPVPTDTWSGPDQVRPFAEAVAGTDCRLAMNVMPRFMPPEDFRRMAKMLYDAGSDRLFFWDSYQRDHHRGCWNALRRLGHRGEIDHWHAAGEPPLGTPLTERELKERCARLRDVRPEALERDRAIQPLLTLAGWNMQGFAPG